MHAARLFLAAMNIASLGLWWWRPTDHYARVFERVTDLKAGASAARMELNMRGAPKFQWQGMALREQEFGRVALCFGMIAKMTREQQAAIVEPYLTGLGLLAKSDMYLNLAANACVRFGTALVETMRHSGDWDGTDATLPAAVAGALAQMSEEDQGELLDLLGRFRSFPPNIERLTIEQAAILKLVADAGLIKSMQERAKSEGWEPDPDPE